MTLPRLVPALLLCACATTPRGTTSSPYATLVDDVITSSFRDSPSLATYLGVHDYDHLLENPTGENTEARIAELERFVARFEALDRSSLSRDDGIDARALEAQVRSELFELKTLRTWEKNPMLYASVAGSIDGLMKRSFAPPAVRLRSVIARLEQVPQVFAAGKANVKTPAREFTDLAIRMAKGSAGFFKEAVPAWAREGLATEPSLQAPLESANRKAIAAAEDFVRWLETDLLPRSTHPYAIGAEAFVEKLALDEMIRMPLDELLARGQAQLEKDHAAFVATAKRIDPTLTAAEVMKKLSDEHPTADDLIPSVRRSVEAARQFLVDRDLITIPSEVRARIEETPAYDRSGSFASMDTPGPYEQVAKEAFYYVTPVEPEWDDQHKEEHLRLYNPYVVASINVHEAYPGHYVQFLYVPMLPTKVRRFVAVSSNAEGWAHYAEEMMAEQGFTAEPKYRLAQLQEALLRDCRYVVGIKLHTEGWTVEQGAKLFEEMGFQEPANAYEEARRGAYNPTYLYYTLGKLEVMRLRDDYMKAKGATLKQFHDAFMAAGPLPLPLVRELLLGPAGGVARRDP